MNSLECPHCHRVHGQGMVTVIKRGFTSVGYQPRGVPNAETWGTMRDAINDACQYWAKQQDGGA